MKIVSPLRTFCESMKQTRSDCDITISLPNLRIAEGTVDATMLFHNKRGDESVKT